ncbi:PAS domain-containing sensor histidine kinase, partial [Staphylococcus aureus]|nr:PAS domain-containing sensor histidine kinase [Staphylococcus aureus]
TFASLTETIVLQVGDLRRMVDEFSSFARMPKPVFRPEPVLDIVRQAMFLQEVANHAIRYALAVPETLPLLMCDRRQIAQSLTNL